MKLGNRGRLVFRFLILLTFITFSAYAENGKFLLLLGPSGVGKSTLINYLKEFDSKFVYISPYTTRPLRPGEVDKVHTNIEHIKELDRTKKLLTVNCIYGIYYATPKDIIDTTLQAGNFPILDWPADKINVMSDVYRNDLFVVYIEPNNFEELKVRLSFDGRDKEGKRYEAGISELENYYKGLYDPYINLKVKNFKGKDREAAKQIYQAFVQ